jgi:hypothetical protein
MYVLETVMRKTFLFLVVLAGSCLGITGCIGALGGLIPGLLSEVGLSLLGTLVTSLVGSIVPTTAA